jgi:hypothetical protein
MNVVSINLYKLKQLLLEDLWFNVCIVSLAV